MLPKWIGYQTVNEGRIIERKKDKILIVLNPECTDTASCATCGGNGSCTESARPNLCTVTSTDKLSVEPGTRIQITHFIFNKAFAALLVFGTPLVFAFCAMILRQSITGSDGDSIWTIVAGGTGLLIGFLFAAVADRILKNMVPTSKIVSILEGPVIAKKSNISERVETS